MHSSIFQLSRKPISKNQFIVPDRIPEYFTYSIADYTDDCNDYRKENYKWLSDFLNEKGAATIDLNQKFPLLTFSEDAAKSFFAKRYEAFSKEVKKLSEALSLDGFITYDFERLVASVQDIYNGRFGFYVMLTDEEDRFNDMFMTLDDFMRSKYATGSYYLGGVVDYHF